MPVAAQENANPLIMQLLQEVRDLRAEVNAIRNENEVLRHHLEILGHQLGIGDKVVAAHRSAAASTLTNLAKKAQDPKPVDQEETAKPTGLAAKEPPAKTAPSAKKVQDPKPR